MARTGLGITALCVWVGCAGSPSPPELGPNEQSPGVSAASGTMTSTPASGGVGAATPRAGAPSVSPQGGVASSGRVPGGAGRGEPAPGVTGSLEITGAGGSVGSPPRSRLDTTAPFLINIGNDCTYCKFPLYVDLVKAADPWRYDWNPVYDATQIELDDEGWIRRLNSTGDHAARTYLGRPRRSGNYQVIWEGSGEFRLFCDDEKTINTIVTAAGPGSISIELPADCILVLDISQIEPSDPVRRISVVHQDYVHSFREQPFYPDILEYLSSFAGVRLSEWQGITLAAHVPSRGRPRANHYSQFADGGSIEWATRICNTLQRDCWMSVSHDATDAQVREMAELLRDQLDPALKLYIEYSTETWNTDTTQGRYCLENGVRLALDPNPGIAGCLYYSQRATEVFKIFESVFAEALPVRVVRVLSGQSGNPNMADVIVNYADSAKHADAYAVEYYLGRASDGGFGGEAMNWNLDQLFEYLSAVEMPAERAALDQLQTLLAPRGMAMIAFKAGQHLVDWGDHPQLHNLYVAANRDHRMGDLYQQSFDAWKSAGGRSLTFKAALGAYGPTGSWGLKESLGQAAADSPKYQATAEWMIENPQWW